MAEKRLEHRNKKLRKDKEYYADYKAFIAKILDKGAVK